MLEDFSVCSSSSNLCHAVPHGRKSILIQWWSSSIISRFLLVRRTKQKALVIFLFMNAGTGSARHRSYMLSALLVMCHKSVIKYPHLSIRFMSRVWQYSLAIKHDNVNNYSWLWLFFCNTRFNMEPSKNSRVHFIYISNSIR